MYKLCKAISVLFAGLRVMMINAVDINLLINFDSAECAFMGEDAEGDKGENKFYDKIDYEI